MLRVMPSLLSLAALCKGEQATGAHTLWPTMGRAMTKPSRREKSTNRLLSHLSVDDFRLLEPHLSPVDLPLRASLEIQGRCINAVYFIEQGFVSIVADGKKQSGIEVGVIGWEGVTGLAVILGSDRAAHAAYMQAAGRGLRMPAAHLRRAMSESPTLQRALLNYIQTFLIQSSYTAMANGRAKIEARLARWLLMAHDRATGDQLNLTHELLGIMLGVRRAGVTGALGLLKKKGLIDTTRKAISIVERAGLEKLAKGIYGAPEAEYQRLFA